MNDAQPPGSDELKAQALALISRKNEAAGALTEELGLPPEDKYHLLSIMYGGERVASDGVSRAEGNPSVEQLILDTAKQNHSLLTKLEQVAEQNQRLLEQNQHLLRNQGIRELAEIAEQNQRFHEIAEQNQRLIKNLDLKLEHKN